MISKKEKKRIDSLVDQGYNAYFRGAKCDSPTHREIDRAAWEIGWRAARNESQKRKKYVPSEGTIVRI